MKPTNPGFAARLILMVAVFFGMAFSAVSAPEEDRLTADLRKAWELLEAGDHDATVAFVETSLGSFEKEAKAQAARMRGFAKKGAELEFHQVNIAGTLGYIKGLARQRGDRTEPALAAFREVWTTYPFAQAWDPQGWFWKPGQAAKKEFYLETLARAARDRALDASVFPAQEDALDHPQASAALAELVSRTLERGDYATLEYLGDRLQRLPLRYSDGTWALETLISTAGNAAGSAKKDESWERTRERLAAWREAFPDSVLPRIAEARRLISHAWQIRGNGVAASVKPEVWPIFGERIAAAKAVLDACPRTCPEWYEEWLTAARAEGVPLEEQVKTFAEGWKAFPGYQPMLHGIIYSLLPRWGGAPGDWHRLALRLGDQDGAAVYTLAVNQAWSFERATILDVPGFDRPLYRRGWKALLDQHPGSLSLIHKCLTIALSLQDTALIADAHRRAGQRYHPAYWNSPDDFLANKRLTLGDQD